MSVHHDKLARPSPQPRAVEPKPAELNAPSAEARFWQADFQQAQKVMERIKAGDARLTALIATLPDSVEMRVKVDTLRRELIAIRRDLANAQQACRELGLPF